MPAAASNRQRPSTSIRPSRGATRPAMACNTEVLPAPEWPASAIRSEEHTPELQSLMRISYAVFCLKKKKQSQPQRLPQRSTEMQNSTYDIRAAPTITLHDNSKH